MTEVTEEYRANYLCECSGSDCDRTIVLSLDEATAIYYRKDWLEFWIIADDCPRGPKPHYTLIEKREGYSLYREATANESN